MFLRIITCRLKSCVVRLDRTDINVLCFDRGGFVAIERTTGDQGVNVSCFLVKLNLLGIILALQYGRINYKSSLVKIRCGPTRCLKFTFCISNIKYAIVISEEIVS